MEESLEPCVPVEETFCSESLFSVVEQQGSTAHIKRSDIAGQGVTGLSEELGFKSQPHVHSLCVTDVRCSPIYAPFPQVGSTHGGSFLSS